MTDARHPEKWLMDKRIQRLTADEYRAYSMSLMWAVSNRTDGHLVQADLPGIPHFKADYAGALVKAELWNEEADGWSITDYMTTQTSRAQLEAAENARAKDAQRKANERSKAKAQQGPPPELCSPTDSPADKRSETSRPMDSPTDDVGKARTGKDRPSTKAVASEKVMENHMRKIIRAFPDCSTPGCDGKLNQAAVDAGSDSCADCVWNGRAAS
jgi:hypothetical protein